MDTEELYEQTAKKHNTTSEDVKNEIQHAIERGYFTNGKMKKVFGNRVPSVEEIITYIVRLAEKNS